MDHDEKSDLIVKNGGALYVVNLNETTGVEIENIIEMNADINRWKIQIKDIFVAAGNFMGREKEQQMLIVAGK